MKKAEFIERYGEDAWEKKLEQTRAWYKAHREEVKAYAKDWREAHQEQIITNNKEYYEKYREELKTKNKEWRDEHPEEVKKCNKTWRENHPEQILKNQHEMNRKGGKYYDKQVLHLSTGLQGEKNKIRKRHRKEYQPFKDIIAPDSQIHHEWIPLSYEYRGLALVEAKPHQYGIIDVILILDGTITLLTEEDVKNSEKKQDDTV